MYNFEIDSAIGQVIKKQSRKFWFGIRCLSGKDHAVATSRERGERHTNHLRTYFVDGDCKGCQLEIFDAFTRDRANKYLFFITKEGEFCRFWKEKDMFGMTGLGQHVYTVLSADGKSVEELRVMVDEDARIVKVKDEDRDEYKRLCLQRKEAEEKLQNLKTKGDPDAFIL